MRLAPSSCASHTSQTAIIVSSAGGEPCCAALLDDAQLQAGQVPQPPELCELDGLLDNVLPALLDVRLRADDNTRSAMRADAHERECVRLSGAIEREGGPLTFGALALYEANISVPKNTTRYP